MILRSGLELRIANAGDNDALGKLARDILEKRGITAYQNEIVTLLLYLPMLPC